ncbi:MAG: CHAT domain-containing protein [Microcoleaceae cyanobacterium]
MSLFEITIQPQRQPDEWPVSVRIQDQGGLPIQKMGTLRLGPDDLQQLSGLLSQPKKYGVFLGQRLFQEDLLLAFREAFVSSRDLLRILFTAAVDPADPLKTLHWERLCAPIDGSWEYLALNQRSPFSQYLPTSNLDRIYRPIGQQDLRALVVVANPEDLEDYSLASFDVESTVAGLRQALGEIPCDVLATGIRNAEPTLNQLCQQLSTANPPYTLVHFVCHGNVNPRGQTILYLSDEANQVDPVMSSNLIQRLRSLGSKAGLPHLIFLCSCSTGSPLGSLAQSLVQELAIPAVIAMTAPVSVTTGLELSQAFYPRLKELGVVDTALQQASVGLAARYDIMVPALFSRLGDRPLFATTSETTAPQTITSETAEKQSMTSQEPEKSSGQSGGISFGGGNISIGGDVVAGDQRKEIHNVTNITNAAATDGTSSTVSPEVLKQELFKLLGDLKSSVKKSEMNEDDQDVVIGQISAANLVVKKSNAIIEKEQIEAIRNHLKEAEAILTSSVKTNSIDDLALGTLKQIFQLLNQCLQL